MSNDGLNNVSPPKVQCRVSVETAEQIQFTFEIATAGTRIIAWLLDIVIQVVGGAIIALLLAIVGAVSPELSSGLMSVIFFLAIWGYFTLFEWLWSGFTPGKRIMGIRVVRTDGVSIDLIRSAMRNLLRAADGFYAIGLFTMFVTGGRRLGDLAADVMVIREEPSNLRDLPPLPHEAQEMSAQDVETLGLLEQDLALIDEFFRRRHLFSPDRAAEMAQIISQPAAKRLGLERVDPELFLAGLILAGRQRQSVFDGVVR